MRSSVNPTRPDNSFCNVGQPDVADLDFWSFTSRAKRRIEDKLENTDADPSHLALWLNRASGIVTYATETTIHRPNGLSWATFRALFVIWVCEEIEQSKLAELTNSSRATTSNVVKSLLARELINRHPSQADGRTSLLTLTEKGSELATLAYREQNRLLEQWSSVLTDDEQRTLMELLEKLMNRRDVFRHRDGFSPAAK